ncbi:MAG: metal-dependent transcriptional regulator [Verrucomicrobia bacterium]|nr:metal-dependent transcriptional regulator [Verrucomicrobiota bacterium]
MTRSTPRAEPLSSSLEDYLEAIYRLTPGRTAARGRDIAERLRVRRSSVTLALRSLSARGLVNYAPYDRITLTAKGRTAARDISRRHEALRHFFVKVLEVEEQEAERAACKMEHALSPALRRRLTEFARFMKRCPLGGPQWVKGRRFHCPAPPVQRRRTGGRGKP